MQIMTRQIGVFVALTVLVAACQIPQKESRGIEVGMKKIQVLNLLGPASVRNTFVKQTEHIWGPQEAWWDQVEMGDSLENWLYIYPEEGTLYVYFLKGSDSVSFMAFTPTGVVY
ncbi:MAG: hypothetical protein O7G29_04855 [Acidobacteria bacterium]|nr:hypothetical protein [Acidobacteriota bacterium]